MDGEVAATLIAVIFEDAMNDQTTATGDADDGTPQEFLEERAETRTRCSCWENEAHHESALLTKRLCDNKEA